MKRKMGILVSLLLIAIVVGVVVGVIIVTRPVGFVGVIVSTGDMQVYSDLTCTIPVASFDLGSTLNRGNIVSKTMYLKNIGESTLYIAYNPTLPTGITLQMNKNSEDWAKEANRVTTTSGTVYTLVATFSIGGSAASGAFNIHLDFTCTDT